MMLLVIPFWKDNAAQTETLVDWIFQLNKRKPFGSALFVASNEVHAEARERIKVSAELAFEHSEMIQLEKFEGVKNDQINFAFRHTSNYINRNYRAPFFWMEPDTTPLAPGWLKAIEKSYEGQPKRYSGSFMQAADKSLFASRAICYPSSAYLDLSSYCIGFKNTFNVEAGAGLTQRTTKTRLVAELVIKSPEDSAKILPTAVAVHGDKMHILLKQLKEKFE